MNELELTADAASRQILAAVQAAFARVHRERMVGLPFINPALQVELVGLRRWCGMWLGVLVTPWFMNLMLLPAGAQSAAPRASDGADWPQLPTGAAKQYVFPAGVFEFIAGREAEAGDYLACSLFSPMFDFTDQDSARQTAQACLEALFVAERVAPPQSAAAHSDQPESTTKRDFLRGRWHRNATAEPAFEGRS